MQEWKLLPGGILTYGDTGFEIREMPDARSPVIGGRGIGLWTSDTGTT